MTDRRQPDQDPRARRPGNVRAALLVAGVALLVYVLFVGSGVVGALSGGG